MKLTDPEILKHLKNGGKVSRSSIIWHLMLLDGCHFEHHVDMEGLAADDWEPFTEYFDFLEAVKRMEAGNPCAYKNLSGSCVIHWIDRHEHIILHGEGGMSICIEDVQSTKWYEVPE